MSLTVGAQREPTAVAVYGLFDPRDGSPFYVGVTSRSASLRMSGHLHEAKAGTAGAKADRIRAILASGVRPEFDVLEAVPKAQWVEAEQFWISYVRSLGFPLTNRGIGGPGCLGSRQSSATRERRRTAQANAATAQMHTPAAREKAANALRHSIEIDGVVHQGIKRAARALGLSSSALHNRLDRGMGARLTGPKVGYLKPLKGRPSGDRHHHSRTILIGGVEYWGLNGAARTLGVCVSTIQKWLRSGKAQYADGKPPLRIGLRYRKT